MSEAAYDALRLAVDGERMWRDLEVFDRYTKFAGSPEEVESLAHVERAMAAAGFVTETILHDAYISLPGAAEVKVAGRSFACITQSFSKASPAEGVTATGIDLRAGSEADYAGKDVRGRIVVLDGIANPVAARRASRAGAAGQLHISPHAYRHNMCVSPVWGNPSHLTLNELPSTVIVTVSDVDGATIRAILAEAPDAPITLHAEVETAWRQTPILIAELPSPSGGADEPFVLLSGHHDAWFEGTMDNGGANATMMEVSRLLAGARRHWRRGLRVAFWSGHSQGRYSSSAWYADQHWSELARRCVAHVNVDSTGGKGNTVVANTGSSVELRAVAREAVQREGGETLKGRRMNRAGDQSFWGIGVPSLYTNMSEQPPDDSIAATASTFGTAKRLAHGTGWWWHTPHDRLDKMDRDILVRDTRVYLLTLWRLLTEPVLPLDYAAYARELSAELRALQAAAGEAFDLAPLIERAGRLAAAVERLDAAKDETRAEILNAARVALSRALVPLDYTLGDRFDHDPALPQGPLPALQPVRGFAGLAADSDEARFLRVGMTRERNRAAEALDTAIRVAEHALAELTG